MRGRDVEIMCTLTVTQIFGPESFLHDMHAAGMRAVRINTAHLDGVQQLQDMTERLKSLFPDIRILIDTKGPEMRTTAMEHDAEAMLEPGQKIIVMADDAERLSSGTAIYVNYPRIHEYVATDSSLLIDDGRIELRVDSVDGPAILTHVMQGGLMGSRKGMAVVGVDVDLPAVSPRDRMYIAYAASSPLVDVIAHSFVRSAADVLAVREAMIPGCKPIIAKIENQQGIDNLASIIAVSDGILIARGDLTASIGSQAIPQAQASIAKATKETGLELMLATNILPSMMTATVASEQDASGIETAKDQGVDVMLLTNETAAGQHPVQTVQALSSLWHSDSHTR